MESNSLPGVVMKFHGLDNLRKWLAKNGFTIFENAVSLDEAHRMKPSRNARVINRWPLIELRMRRFDCLNWMTGHGFPKPPRSACVFCPFQSDREWERLKTEEPNDFARASVFEREFQIAMADCGFTGGVYLHPSMKPLDTVDFSPDTRQADLWGNECEGMCGV